MCGIFGYVGPKNAVEVTLNGLKKLEYRGYDSAGIAGIIGGELQYCKKAGKIAELQKELGKQDFSLDLAIAQTRWATHGAPNEKNAHPHFSDDRSLAVVHNGIIENHTPLREMLQNSGIVFRSDTDTEVIAHLIAHFYKGDILAAIQQASNLMKGSFAVCMIHRSHPGEIYVFTSESPMALGIGNGEMFVASDVHAFAGHAKKVVYLENGEVARIQENGYELFDPAMQIVTKEVKELTHIAEEVTLGEFEHYTLKEIHEQPQTVRSALAGRISEEHGTAHFDTLTIPTTTLQGVKRIILLGCGTSYYAGFVAQYMFEEIARIPAQVEISSEFRYKNPIVAEGTLVIAISQSGETADTLAAVRELKAKGAEILAVCNVYESSLVREAHSTLYLRAGVEIGVCSTKAFTSQVVTLALFSLLMARMRNMDREQGIRFIEELKKLPEAIESVLKKAPEIQSLAKKYHHYQNFFFLGRRFMYPGALEGALKLKEISYINANGYPAGEMKHGPIALINPECPTVALTSDHVTYEKILSNLMEVKARSGKVLAISSEGSPGIKEIADDVVFIPKIADELAVIPTAIVLQLFAYYVAYEKGSDIDQPRNLAKSVTVE